MEISFCSFGKTSSGRGYEVSPPSRSPLQYTRLKVVSQAHVPVLSRVQVFQKYSPGGKIVPSGGFSPMREAETQFGSEGAAASVDVMAGTVTVVGVRVDSIVVCGVSVGRTAISVNDLSACTV